MNDKRVLAHWRVFCRETNQIKNISPELRKALIRGDNIRMKITRQLMAKRENNEKL